MTGSLTVARRFCGPPDSGNGGYVCGLIAGFLDATAEVTLRLPPPLGRPLAVERHGQGSVRVLDGQNLIAEATALPAAPHLQLPDPVSIQQAGAAARNRRCGYTPNSIHIRRALCAGRTAAQVTACVSASDQCLAPRYRQMSGARARNSRTPAGRSGPSSCGPRWTARESSGRCGTPSPTTRSTCWAGLPLASSARSRQATRTSWSAGGWPHRAAKSWLAPRYSRPPARQSGWHRPPGSAFGVTPTAMIIAQSRPSPAPARGQKAPTLPGLLHWPAGCLSRDLGWLLRPGG